MPRVSRRACGKRRQRGGLTMAAVTVGVPVYNGDAYLDECLACLESQTFKDFEVLIFDNASTDRTSEIAQTFASRDARFKYVRQPYNKGATQNFLDVLHAAHSEFFIWRAHDDRSSANFLAALHAAFERRPQTRLAVGRLEKIKIHRSKRRIVDVFNLNTGQESLRLARVLLHSQASWFYGLWKRETLVHEFGAVWKLYPFGWGSDHLTLLRVLVRNEVTGSNEATFIQSVVSKRLNVASGGPASSADEMRKLKTQFTRTCWGLLRDVQLTPEQRLTLKALIPVYSDKRAYSQVAIIRARLRESLHL